MKIRLALAALAPLALLSPAQGEPAKGAPRLEDVLPAGAPLVFLVEDAPGLKGKWEVTPFGRTWADAGVQKFFAPALDRFREGFEEGAAKNPDAKEGMDLLKEVPALFQGQVAIYLSDDLSWTSQGGRPPQAMEIPEPGMEGEEPPAKPVGDAEAEEEEEEPEAAQPRGVLLAELKDKAGDWAKLNGRAMELEQKRAAAKGEELREVTEEFQGETLHVREKIRKGKTREASTWAVVDGFLVMGEPKAEVQKAIAALKKGAAESPLSASATFQKVRRRCPKTDVLLYANLEPWMALAKKAMAEEANPMMGDPEAMAKALGLDVLQGAFLSATFEASASEMDLGILYSENRGVVRLLAFQEGAATRPAFLPEDAVQFSSSRFSVKALWDAVMDVLQACSPMLGAMAQNGLDQFTKQNGVDLRKDLVGNLGDEFLGASVLVREAGKPVDLASDDQLFALSLADTKSFDTALDTAVRSMARLPAGAEPGEAAEMFETRDYLGHTIHVLKQPIPAGPQGGEKHLQYAVADRWLLVSLGKGGALEAALAALAKPGKSVWERAEVKEALETLPAGASGLGYSDLGVLVGGLFEQAASAQLAMAMMGGAEGFCDPTAKPDGKEIGKLWGPCASAQYRDADGLLFRTRLLHPKP